MDLAVLKTYGWGDITLAHDFYDVDYLPENDRTRFTISPEARKEILQRLLALNHLISQEEQEYQKNHPSPKAPRKTKKKNPQTPDAQRSLFPE
ncbi:MAG: hypothetical protein GY757_08900 [bacterium]|nr:hypothetical protein [bacterium]